MNIENFETYLRQGNMAENTVAAYLYAVKEYYSRHKELNKRNLLVYKTYLIEKFKPKTVNLRIQAMNKYLDCMGKSRLRLKSVKVQQRSYLENVISNADYVFLKNKLKKEENQEWYFVVRFLAATGARVSELIQMKVEHVQMGYFDIYTKGGKIRRIYIPKALRKEATEWLGKVNRTTGYLFLNRFGERITTRGIAQQLKNYALKYGLNEKVVYPHSFRHRFAKNFLEKFNDISLLADLMGHESIETTRIYLRRSSAEQQEIVDKVITWGLGVGRWTCGRISFHRCLALRQVKMAQISCAKRFSVLRQTIFQSAENGFQVCRHPFYGLCRDG